MPVATLDAACGLRYLRYLLQSTYGIARYIDVCLLGPIEAPSRYRWWRAWRGQAYGGHACSLPFHAPISKGQRTAWSAKS